MVERHRQGAGHRTPSTRTSRASDWEGSLHALGRLCAHARRQPDRHRQRHRQPRDRQAGGRPDQAHRSSWRPARSIEKVVVSEAGASVYSASEFASKELPELDVSLRGAVSIARRLQDPLAELVKIDPKSIGVGQYQHDVNQSELARSAGRGGRGLRELGRRRPEHRVGAAAGARVGPERRGGGEHRALARRQRRVPQPPAAARRDAAWAPRPSSRRPASCASATATTRWTCPACTPRPTRWCERMLAAAARPVGRGDGPQPTCCAR